MRRFGCRGKEDESLCKEELNRPKFKFPSSLVKALLDAITSIGLYMDRTESGERILEAVDY